MPGLYQRRRLRSCRLRRRRRRARRAAAARRHRGRRRRSSGLPPPACIPTAIRWCARWWRRAAWPGPSPRRLRRSRSLGEAILTPTRIYVKSCLAAMRATKAVKGLAHITGGGFPDNIPRVLPKGLGARIDLGKVPVLPVFKWLASEGGIAQNEMLRTFNCGIGMIVDRRAEGRRRGRRRLSRKPARQARDHRRSGARRRRAARRL